MKERDFIQIVVEMWPVTRDWAGCQIMLKFLRAHSALAMMNNQNNEHIQLLRGIVNEKAEKYFNTHRNVA